MKDLKPCPFCGSDKVVEDYSNLMTIRGKDVQDGYIECLDCECHGPYINTCESNLEESWNSRHIPLKELIWHELTLPDDEFKVWHAETPFGDYAITMSNGKYAQFWTWEDPYGYIEDEVATSFEDAKNKAQADFVRRIGECVI